MEWLKGYTTTLIVCVLISAVAMAAIPSSPVKKTLRFLLGLITIVLLITPVTKLVVPDAKISFSFEEYAVDEELAAQMEDLAAQQTRSIFAAEIEEEIKNIYQSAGKEGDAHVSVSDGAITEIQLNPYDPDVARTVATRLGISSSCIR